MMSLKRRSGFRTHVNLTIARDVAQEIDLYADEYGMSRSFAIEFMCRRYLKDMKNGKHVKEIFED